MTVLPASAQPIIVYFNGTFVHRLNGAHARVKALIDFLLARGSRVILYSFSDHSDCPWGAAEIALFAARFPDVELILDRRPGWFRLATRFKKLLSGAWPAFATPLVRSRLPLATPRYRALCRAWPQAPMIVNYANGLVELNGACPKRTIVETHDLDFVQFAKRFGHAITSRRIGSKFRSELGLLGATTGLIAIAPIEAGMFRMLLPNIPVFFVPDYGSAAPAVASGTAPRRFDLLFVGSENIFNVDGICAFLADASGFLAGRTLAIAGRVSLDPRVIAAARGSDNVALLGFVEDLGPVYAAARIVISPVDGTGLKIKVVEALAAGKPVFGSRHTIDGLPPGAQACVFPMEAGRMAEMLADPILLDKAATAARCYAGGLASAGDLAKLDRALAEAQHRPS